MTFSGNRPPSRGLGATKIYAKPRDNVNLVVTWIGGNNFGIFLSNLVISYACVLRQSRIFFFWKENSLLVLFQPRAKLKFSLYKIRSVLACSDWSIPVVRSGYPNTEIPRQKIFLNDYCGYFIKLLPNGFPCLDNVIQTRGMLRDCRKAKNTSP